MKHATAHLLIAGAMFITGCSDDPITGPPELRLGRVECAECGMIVSEDRFSSAMLVERRGRREHVAFDDIGCMLDHEREHQGSGDDTLVILGRYVHDHEARSWVDAAEAVFLLAEPERLPTPMGSGIAAFAAQSGADALREEVGGDAMSYAELVSAREQWMRARYGPRPGAR